MMDQIPLQISIPNKECKNFVSAFNNDGIRPEPSSSNILCNVMISPTTTLIMILSTKSNNIRPDFYTTAPIIPSNKQYFTPSFAINANFTIFISPIASC